MKSPFITNNTYFKKNSFKKPKQLPTVGKGMFYAKVIRLVVGKI